VRYLILGGLDGIITAGTLSAYVIFRGGALTIDLIMSLTLVVATINALTVFVAEFSHQMREVRELSYKVALREERMSWTLLHTRALRDTLKSVVSNFFASMLGALAVLIPAYIAPYAFVISVAAAVVLASFVMSDKSWRGFIELVATISGAVFIGLLIGLTFPVIT
jgi:VIT1/CCC1 family predicted Fe2+/Mn2+ transporter